MILLLIELSRRREFSKPGNIASKHPRSLNAGGLKNPIGILSDILHTTFALLEQSNP